MSLTKEEMNNIPEGEKFTSDVITCTENGQGSWLGITELGHRVYLNAPKSPGESLEYIVAASKRTGNHYCVPTNPEPRQQPSNFSQQSYTPKDVTNILRQVVYEYAVPQEGKYKSLSEVLEEKLGFTAPNHQVLLATLLIACTKH